MRLFLGAIILALAVGGSAFAQESQDPTKTLPKSYKLEFENDWVRVVRVHYDAKAKLPEHGHPAGMLVFLYLNASDGVLFTHGDEAPVPRPPVQPGAIRVATTPEEHHTVVNNAATPTDFIRVLLKTDVNWKVSRPNARMAPGVMEYEHSSLRVSRTNVQPGVKTRIGAKNYPILRIALIPDKAEWRVSTKDGYRFLDKGTTEEFEVAGNVPMQLLTIELRTPIAKPPSRVRP